MLPPAKRLLFSGRDKIPLPFSPIQDINGLNDLKAVDFDEAQNLRGLFKSIVDAENLSVFSAADTPGDDDFFPKAIGKEGAGSGGCFT